MGVLLRMAGQREKPLSFVRSPWLHWKVSVNSVKGNIKGRQFLGEREREKKG